MVYCPLISVMLIFPPAINVSTLTCTLSYSAAIESACNCCKESTGIKVLNTVPLSIVICKLSSAKSTNTMLSPFACVPSKLSSFSALCISINPFVTLLKPRLSTLPGGIIPFAVTLYTCPVPAGAPDPETRDVTVISASKFEGVPCNVVTSNASPLPSMI